MKVDFVFPPIPYKFAETQYTPLGIGYLAATVRERCEFVESVGLIDGQILDEEEYWQELAKLETDVALISATLRQMRGARRSAEVIRSCNPGARIIVGGAGPSTLFTHEPDFMIGTEFDVAVMGEAEEILPVLLSHLQTRQDLSGIANLTVRVDEQSFRTDVSSARPDVNSIPWPARDLFNEEAYLARWRKATDLTSVHIMGSRGCPFGCTFCDQTITGRRMRYRDPADVVAEMLFLQRRYSPDDIFCFDDIFTVNHKRVLEICKRLIDRPFQTAWSAQGRVDCVDAEMLQQMKAASCEELYFGVESGSERILKQLGKRITPAQIIEAFDLCHQAGINPGAYLIVGVPGETREDIVATAELIRRIEPTLLNFSVLTPFPNTVLYEQTQHLIGEWDYENWDDFGGESIYTCDFEIDPLEARELIRAAYLGKIEGGMEISQYQAGSDEWRRHLVGGL